MATSCCTAFDPALPSFECLAASSTKVSTPARGLADLGLPTGEGDRLAKLLLSPEGGGGALRVGTGLTEFSCMPMAYGCKHLLKD